MTYDAGADMAERYPEWVVRHRPLHGVPEVLCRRRRVILVDQDLPWSGKRSALAHAVAHLDLGHSLILDGVIEAREERAADRMAARRLISTSRLEQLLRWTGSRTELAAELDVTTHMLDVRLRTAHPSERALFARAAEHRDLAA